ncbi:MAG: branched-chain amino acid ABC transporter permease [Burkholderiaceae bacterium]|jgi:branched-chain amino acid transport system permease protein
MTGEIALWLAQDGMTSGAIYALLALALLLVFAVTRVIFVPQGEFVVYAALTLGTLQLGQTPATAWMLVGAGALVAATEGVAAWRERAWQRLPRIAAVHVALPVAVAAAAVWLAPRDPGLAVQMALTAALVVPLGPMLYRLAYQPLAQASVLVLFIVSMAVHYAMMGMALVMFGAEGLRTSPIAGASFALGPISVGAQSLWVLAASLACMAALAVYFGRNYGGKALRATAVNRVGARLVGIPPARAGRAAFTLAAAIGTLSGILISPIVTVYYDTGLMFGLKGFVGAILGGMASYPLAVLGALGVGLLEAFSSFWASQLKEVIVFTLILPVLLWRSLAARGHEIEQEEE